MATTSSVSDDETLYGREEVEPESEYSVLLRYPILYDNAASDYDTNGLGALSDALSCIVNRTFNQFPTLQMTYKRDGIHAKELQEGRIIMTDLGPDLVHQKFRINQIQKSVDNLIVNATHIAGDIAYNTITQDIQLPNASANDVFNTLINSLADQMPDIRFDTDISTMSNVNMQMSSGNAGNLLIDADQEGDDPTQSMAALFKGEWVFDNYHYYLQQNGGSNTGLVIKYGRDLKTITQDTNIANTYTAIFPYATYTPAPAKATDANEDWTSIGLTGFINSATATYAAGGAIDIYSSPVTGHRIVGQITNGSHIQLLRKITDGETLSDNNVVNTVNGDDWYFVLGSGWIDARWVTFDKSGDYLINNAVGHATVDIGIGSGRQTKYPFSGRGVVSYSGSGIHAYYSPFLGADKPSGDNDQGHVRVSQKVDKKWAFIPTGTYVNFDNKAINEKGDVWYRIAGQPHRWLYGPHISFKKTGTYIKDPTASGKAAIKSGAQKYVMRKGKIQKAPDGTKWVSTRTSKTKEYKTKRYTTKYHGKKINQKATVKNKAYSKKKPVKTKTTIKKGVYKIIGQIQYNGTTYYETSNHAYVTSGGVDWKDPMSSKPKTIDESVKGRWTNGKIEMYSEPKFGTAMNWGIPNGESFSTGPTAHGDGEDWTQVTYKGQTGWVLSKYLKVKRDEDFASYNPDDLESSDDTQQTDTNVDVADLTVKLPEGMLYADSAYGQEIARVQNVDLSSYFQHDYQDESGFNQTTGKYEVTQADIDQLRQLAQAYMKEHRFGEPNVSLTLTREQISDFQLDDIGLYDKVTVQFDQLGIYEEAEVTAATWDALAHRYNEITIGDLPVSYEHELLQTANKNTNLAVKKSASEQRGRITNLTAEIHQALNMEGSDRKAAYQKLEKELGLETTSRVKIGKDLEEFKGMAVTEKAFTAAMQKYDQQMADSRDWILSGGTTELQFLDSSGNKNFVHPTQIVAYDQSSNTKMYFNSNGIGWLGENNAATVALDSRGWINAEHINAGTIQSLHSNELNITGSFTAQVGNYTITMGAFNPGANALGIEDIYGNLMDTSKGFTISSPNYAATIGSGELAISGTGGSHSNFGPTYWKLVGGIGSATVQLNDYNNAAFDLVTASNEYIMKKGAMSIRAASGNWHRVITSGNIGNYCYVTINGSRHYISVDSIPTL